MPGVATLGELAMGLKPPGKLRLRQAGSLGTCPCPLNLIHEMVGI